MLIEHGGQRYELIRGSDTVRDGLYIELSEYIPSQSKFIDTSYWKVILYTFRSDVDGSVTFSCYKEEIAFHLVEIFMAEVKKQLLTNEDTPQP